MVWDLSLHVEMIIAFGRTSVVKVCPSHRQMLEFLKSSP